MGQEWRHTCSRQGDRQVGETMLLCIKGGTLRHNCCHLGVDPTPSVPAPNDSPTPEKTRTIMT